MPIIHRTRPLVPANARNADVASNLINQITGLQQHKTAAAFRVQGFEAYLYNQLKQGKVCTCKSSETTTQFILGEDGKASQSTINELLTGQEFTVTAYDPRLAKLDPVGDFYDSNHSTTFQVLGDGPSTTQIEDGQALGDNGEFDPAELEAIVNSFDTSELGFSDVSCPVCFGSGYVGGYSLYKGFRLVLTPQDTNATLIDYTTTPMSMEACKFDVAVVLPRGGLAVDSLRAFNKDKVQNAKFWIDDILIDQSYKLLLYCDGRPHKLTVDLTETFTHLEIQIATAKESAFFEFPKQTKSSDMALLEQVEPFQILMSPDVPHIDQLDIIVESSLGKVLLVQNANIWQTRNRANLGWEVQVRVIQPQELFRILPKRGTVRGQLTTNKTKPSPIHKSSGY